MKPEDMQKRLHAAEALFSASSTSRSKFDSIRTLISGINPHLDKKLGEVSKVISHIEKLGSGDAIGLGLEGIPAHTEKDKQRKKLLLLLIRLWTDLKAEVKRVEAELSQTQSSSPTLHSSPLAKIAAFAKGPLGIVTLVAVAIVVVNSQAATITIKNNGCDTIDPRVSLPFPIAGIKLPSEPIANRGEGTASLPPLTLEVDGASIGSIKLTILGVSMKFDIPTSGMSVRFDERELLGNRTKLTLPRTSTHTLIIQCN